MWVTWLADVLRGAGLRVVEEPGWQTRGFAAQSSPGGGLVALTGGLVHHTGTSGLLSGDYPTRKVILSGRPDVPGPLAQLGLGRSSAWYVFAAGRANHSGAVDDARYSNPQCIGVEAEHPGGTLPWPQSQYESYVRGCAAISLYSGITWRGHKEAAIPYGRKPDPNFSMDDFRADVARVVSELRDHGRAVQEALSAVGFHVVVDGKVGPETVAATRHAQEALGLVVDGYPGPVTLKALRDHALTKLPTLTSTTATQEEPMPTAQEIAAAVWNQPVSILLPDGSTMTEPAGVWLAWGNRHALAATQVTSPAEVAAQLTISVKE